jgi:cytochrome c5
MRRVRAIVWIGCVGFLVAFGFVASNRWSYEYADSVAFAQGNSSANPMRDMMRQMMQGVVPPSGMTPERLPDPSSAGAQLLVQYCEQCHDLPSPLYRTANQWPGVLDRMLGRMDMMGRGMMGRGMMGMERIQAPSTSQARTLLEYLTHHAMIEATASELAAGSAQDRGVFSVTCAQCHALPSPSIHTQQEWRAVVARMEGNMQLMGKPGISAANRNAVVRFLQAASVKTN